MPKIVESIILDFEDTSFPTKTIAEIFTSGAAFPWVQAAQKKELNKSTNFTNYTYFLTISMKHNFHNADHFYNSMTHYNKFLQHNHLVEQMHMSFEFYSKDKTKMHAHALIEFTEHDKKTISLFKQWYKHYFKYTHNISINSINFQFKQICDYSNPDVNITWKYVNKDVHVMQKLNFDTLSYKTMSDRLNPKPYKRKPNKHVKISKSYMEVINSQVSSLYKQMLDNDEIMKLVDINSYIKSLN